MRGIGRIQLAVVTLLAGGMVCYCCPPVASVVLGPFWFLGKVFFVIFFYVWTRSALPRMRHAQLMSFGWKLLLPVSLLNLVATALWIVVRHP
jgi:NADH-quinone oxidoreductase subunit H